MRDDRALALLIGGLTGAIVARSTVIPSDRHFAFNLTIVVFSMGVAWTAGLRSDDLGLARRHVGAGFRYGGAVFLAITAALALAALFGLLDDDRTTIGISEMLLRVLVVIPIGTVVMEEFAFRGVLYGLLEHTATPVRSMVAGSVLFGLWHAPPIAGGGAWTVLGTVVATTVAGAGFIRLRRRSGSLLAPVLAHLGTNSVTFALSWVASRSRAVRIGRSSGARPLDSARSATARQGWGHGDTPDGPTVRGTPAFAHRQRPRCRSTSVPVGPRAVSGSALSRMGRSGA